MATVFDVFNEVQMDYLTINRGKVRGNAIATTKPIMGIFKYRSGMTSTNNMEAHRSSATVHAHPEDFNGGEGIIGNGIRYGGQTYQITGVTFGTNFDTGDLEHLTFTLEVANYVTEG